jgi:SAM-dependent methyltransferase
MFAKTTGLPPNCVSGGGTALGHGIIFAVQPGIKRKEYPGNRRSHSSHRGTQKDKNAGMSSYVGRHAELYDLFYADKPYAKEAAFIHSCFKKLALFPPREILELACGTGRHAFELEKHGYQITATDYSEDMLRVAQRSAAQNSSKVRFLPSDLRNPQVPAGAYDAAICLFDSIGYLRTNDALAEAFVGIERCLRPNGLFIFEFWHAPAMLSQHSPVRLRRWTVPAGEVLRISETTLDRKNQLAHVSYTVYELKNDGTYSTFCEQQTNRFFFPEEIRTLISGSGFEMLKFYAGFQEEESIDANTWHLVAVARKAQESG